MSGDLRASPAALPCLLAAVALLVLVAAEGGFQPAAWYGAAVLVLALLAVCLIALPLPRPGWPAFAAAGLAFAYAAWSWLSVSWADDQGAAVEGANRALFYALVFALFALWPLHAKPAMALIGLLTLGIAAIGLVELLRVGSAQDPVSFFFRGRLSEPVGYANANVALWAMGMWSAIVLAGRREQHPALSGLFLGSAGVLSGLSLLGQSRGWLLALPAVAVVAVAITPGRGRVLVALAAVALGVLAMASPVLSVYDDAPDVAVATSFPAAQRAILIVSAVLVVVGALAALVDQRVDMPADSRRRVSAGIVALALLCCVAGVGAYAVVEGSPFDRVSQAWTDFKEGGSAGAGEGSRLSDVATNRYDFWRVAWDNFEAHPLIGVGADNFQEDYLRRGTSAESPRHPHSLELKVLSQTGLVGALMLLGVFAAAGLAASPALWRGPPSAESGPVAAGVVVFAYFLLHGSVDWLWEFAGLGGVAFACLGIAVAAAKGGEAVPRSAGGLVRVPALVGAAVVALALVPAWFSERGQERALDEWRKSPADSFDRLDRAAALNPWSATPAVIAGSIAVTLGDEERAVAEFREALRRDPRNSYALLMLGALLSQQGNEAAARRLLARAVEAAPNAELANAARRRVARGRRLDASRVAASLRSATERRVARDFQD